MSYTSHSLEDRLRFQRIVRTLLEHEGGYVNDPDDAGGETKFGISKRSYPLLDIKAMTERQAADIYYKEWYLPLRLNEIDDDRIACKVLDTCVNLGKKPGMMLFQQALKERGHTTTLNGIVSRSTIDGANRANVEKLLEAMRRRQAAYYRGLVDAKPVYAKYLKGWLKRAYS